MRKLLKLILKILAKRVIQRYKPLVIGVTGSVGKTTAKEAIYSVVSQKFRSRKSEGNLNNEWGVPMSVLGWNYGCGFSGRLKSFFKSLQLAFGWRTVYPEALILELAADKPGDIEYSVDMVKPAIGVVTAVGEIPVHVEFYASPLEVAKEKARLIKGLPAGGRAVLNYDDQTVLDMKNECAAQTITFGFAKQADVSFSNIAYFFSEDSLTGGLSFNINCGGRTVATRVNNLIGPHQLYGIAAAVAVGGALEVDLSEAALALEDIEILPGRMRLLKGIKNSWIIDDTYNASPLATKAALDALVDFTRAVKVSGGVAPKKIAVLGDMKELGKYEIQAHQSIGNLAGEKADILITVGPLAKILADAAANQMKPGSIFSFNDWQEAGPKVQEIIKEGNLILVKGSQCMRLEKIVKEIMAEPERAGELLCRQYGKWLEN